MTISKTLAVFTLLTLAAGGHCAELNHDWSRFRGPNGTGISPAKTVPAKWTEDDYNWVLKLPGHGHGSPVIVGERLYLVSGKKKSAERIVVCVSTKSGKILWKKPFKSKRHRLHPANNYGSSTPVADEQGVIVTWATPAQLMLKALTKEGDEVWSRDLGPYKAINGAGTSPIIVDDLVIITNIQMDPAVFIRAGVLPKDYPDAKPLQSYLVAVDRKTGKTRWKLKRRSFLAGYTTPCIRPLANGAKELVVIDSYYGITGVNPKTGKVNWQTNKLLHSRTVASPVLAGDLILGSYGRGIAAEKMHAVLPGGKGKKPKVVFTVRRSAPLVPTPIVKDGLIFLWADNGVISCVKADNGEQVWRRRVGGNYYSSPVWVDRRLYNVQRNGDVVVVAAEKKFRKIARVPLGERSYATPAVANGVMYLRTETKLMSLGGKK